jgi:hypothetical protein
MTGYFDLLILIACAVFYYRLGEQEFDLGGYLAGGSILLWAGGAMGLGWGIAGCLALQVAFFVAITGIKLWISERERKS